MSYLAKIEKDILELVPEERALLVDFLLRSFEQPNPDVDKKWADVANKRLAELRSGRVEPVPGDEVFEKALKRIGR